MSLVTFKPLTSVGLEGLCISITLNSFPAPASLSFPRYAYLPVTKTSLISPVVGSPPNVSGVPPEVLRNIPEAKVSFSVGFTVPMPTFPPAPLFGITIKLPETVAVAGPVPFTLRTAKSAEEVAFPPIRRSRVEVSLGNIAPN